MISASDGCASQSKNRNYNAEGYWIAFWDLVLLTRVMKREPKLPVLTAAVPAWAQELQAAPLRPVRTPHATACPSESGSPTQVFLCVGEAAAILKVSSKTVRRLAARGDLKVIRLGRLVRIHFSEIGRLIAVGCYSGGDFGCGEDDD